MSDHDKITEAHRRLRAIVYVRQSSPGQVQNNHESRALQYALRERAIELGWPAESIAVVDEDLARSGSSTEGRLAFKDLVAEVGLGRVGLILGTEVSRLARNNADWYQLLDLCVLTGTLVADSDGIYCPGHINDRMVLGLKGAMAVRREVARKRVSYPMGGSGGCDVEGGVPAVSRARSRPGVRSW